MYDRLRFILIIALLGLYGPVATCGPGSHAFAVAPTVLRVDGDATVPSVQADLPCPICDFHLLGQLPAATTQLAVEPLVASPVDPPPPPVVGLSWLPTARPRAPPLAQIAHGTQD